MKKKALSLLLAAVMLVSLLPVSAAAATTEFGGVSLDCGDAEVTTAENGDLILQYKISSTLTIPEGYKAQVQILAVGGGGGGGKLGSAYAGSGDGGEVIEGTYRCSGTLSITVGSGGSGKSGSPASGSGSAGGDTKVVINGSEWIATGGAGGGTAAKAGTPPSGTTSEITGTSVTYGKGGAKAASSSTCGKSGTNPGDGGTGGKSPTNGGNGADGIVVIRILKIGEAHNFTYGKENGNVLTATCDKTGCADGFDENPLRLTLTQDGCPKGVEQWVDATGDEPVIRYYAASDTVHPLSGEPSGKGDYLVKVTVGSGTNTAAIQQAFTITADHAHDVNGVRTAFEPWESGTELPTEGNYYLTQNVTLGADCTIPGTVNLCLNGHVIVKNGNSVSVDSGAELNFYEMDASAYATNFISGTENKLWYLLENGKLTIGGQGAIPALDYDKYPWYSSASEIKTLEIGAGVTNLPVFYNNKTDTAYPNLQSIVIRSKNFNLNLSGSMGGISTLRTVTFAEGVETVAFVKANTFDQCTALTTLELPASLKSFYVHPQTFSGATAFDTITLAAGNRSFSLVGGNALYNADQTQLILAVGGNVVPASTVTRISAGGNIDVANMLANEAIDNNIRISLKHNKDGSSLTTNVYVGEMIKAEVSTEDGSPLPDGLIYAWLGLVKDQKKISNANTVHVAGFESPSTYVSAPDGNDSNVNLSYLGEIEYMLSPDALYGAVKITYPDFDRNYYGTAQCRFAVCRIIDGKLTVVAKQDFNAKAANDSTYKYDTSMKYIADGNTVTMVKGESLTIEQLLGRCGITHITCTATTVSNVSIQSGGDKVSLTTDATHSTLTADNIGTAEIKFDIGVKANNLCTYHKDGKNSNNTLTVYVIDPVDVSAACTSICVGTPTEGYDYFIGTKKGVLEEDGKIWFRGLTPDTGYVLRMQTIANANALYSQTVSTLPHDFSDIRNNGNGTHSIYCRNGCDGVEGPEAHNFVDGFCDVCHAPDHIHSFTYAAGEDDKANTIIATCSDTDGQCPLTDKKLTLTLAANDSTYNGTAYTGASTNDVAVGFASTTSATVGSIEYWSTGEEAAKLNSAPINAGSYTAKVTVTYGESQTVTATKAFTIAKAAPKASDFTFTPPTSLTYDGQGKAAAATFNTKDGTLSGMGTVTVKYAKQNGTGWGTAADTAPTDAGTYKVYIAVADGSNYTATSADLTADNWKFTIGKVNYNGTKTASGDLQAKNGSTVEITLPTLPTGASYGTAAKTIAADKYTLGTVSDNKITVTSTGIEDGTGAMTFTVPVTGALNYESYDVTVTITPAFKTVVTINATAEGFTYGDSGKIGYKDVTAKVDSTEVSGLAATLVATYYKETATAGTYETAGTTEVPTDAGNYKVVLSVPETNDDYAGSKELTFTIAKKTVELIWAEDDFTYNGTDQAVSVTAKYKDVNGAEHFVDVSVKLSMAKGESSTFRNAGAYTARAYRFDPSDSGSKNYALPETPTKDYTMQPKPVTATVSATKTYDGTAAASADQVTVTVATGIEGETLTVSGVTGTFNSASVADCTTVTADGTGMSVSAGQYTLAANYAVSLPESGAGTITAFDLASATVTVDPTAYDYTGSEIEPAPTVTFDGTNAIPAADYEVGYTGNTNAGTNTATVTVTAKTGNVTNSKSVSFTINKVDYNGTKTASGDLQAKNGSTVEITLPTLPTGASYAETASGFSYGTTAVADGKLTLAVGESDIPAATEPFELTVNVTGATNYNNYSVTVTVTPVFHTHSFSYSAGTGDKANVITATCTCDDYKDGVTLTLTADGGTYNGTAKTAALTGQDAFEAATGATVGSIEYYSGDTKLNSAPTNAGSYTAKVTVTYNTDQTVTATKAFTIAPKEISISWDTTEFTYNGQNQRPTASTEDMVAGDSFNPSYIIDRGTTRNVQDYKNAGTYSVYADFRNSNYEIANGNNQKFTIAKKELTITGATVEAKTYDGNTTANVTAVTLDGLVTGESLTKDTDYTVSGVYDSAAAGTSNKTVTVTVTLSDTEKAGNYTMKGTKELTGQTINKAALTVTAKNKSIAYGDAAANDGVEYSGFVNSETASVLTGTLTYTYQTSGETPTAYTTSSPAGTYDIIPGGLTSNNYAITFVKGTLTVGAKTIAKPTAVSKTYTYSGAEQSFELTGFDASTMNITGNKQTAAGTYTVTVTPKANYAWSTEGDCTFTWVIAKAEVEAPTVGSKVYTGETLTADVDCTGKPYTVTTNVGGTAVGSYDVVLTLSDPANYKWTDSDAAAKTLQFSITKAGNSWTTAPKIENVTYGTAISPVSAAKFGTVSVTYVGTGSTSYASNAIAPTAAGSYKATFSVAATNDYDSLSKDVDFTIAQKEVGLTWSTLSAEQLVYDGAAKTLTATATKLKVCDACTVTVELTQSKDNVNVGAFTYTATALSNANYKLPENVTSGENTITPKPVTVTPDAGQKKTYGENDPAFTYTHDALCGEDTITGAMSRASGENYAENGYAFTPGTLTAGNNYTLQLAESAPTFMIEKKPVTVLDVTVADKTYNGKTDDATFTGAAVFDGLCEGDELTISGVTGTYASPNAGGQKVTFTNTAASWTLSNANYKLAESGHASYAFGKINKAAQTAPTAPAVSGETVTIAEADREKKLEYSLDSESAWISVPTPDKNGAFTLSGLAVGSHTVYLRVKESGNYFASPSASKTFELTKYSVAYNANGGVGSIASQTASSGSSVTVRSGSGFSRNGYTFSGWNTAADGSGTAYAAGASISTGAALYAQWTANSYTVKFNANGGSGAMADEEFTYDTAKALTSNAFTRENYTFTGWATSSNGPVLYTNAQEVKNLAGSGTVTLYAIWAQNVHNITGTITSPQSGSVQVKLRQGNAVYAVQNDVTMSGEGSYTGSFTFSSVPAGTYNVEVTQTIEGGQNVTMTQLVILTADSTANITLPASGVNSKLEVKEDTRPAVVGGLEAEAETNRQSGKDVTVTMTVEKQEEQQLSAAASETEKATQDAISEIKATASGKTLEFMNIEIEKTTTDLGTSEFATEPINETEKVLELVFSYEMNGKRNIKVYRAHDGEAQPFEELNAKPVAPYTDQTFYVDKANHLIYVYAKLFSTYAIGYEQETYYSDDGSAVPAKQPEKCPQDDTCVYAKFTDADTRAWYHDGVHFCVEREIMQGVSDTQFAPNGTLSRAMIVTMLWRLEGEPVANYAMSFKDVPAGQWYTEAIRWAQSTGVVTGYNDDVFGPENNVTREQLAAILMRYAAFKGIDVSARAELGKFTDASSVSAWALDNVKWAVEVGMITGRTETTIVPTGDTTRAEAACMVQRFCEKVLAK